MSSSERRTAAAAVRAVVVTDAALTVELVDGRSVSVPLDWYPRLAHGSPAERNDFRLDDRGEGIHWPRLDEDISVRGLLAGLRSGETEESFERWLRERSHSDQNGIEDGPAARAD